MRRLCLALLVAGSLFAVSCGSGSDDDGAEQVTPSDTEATENSVGDVVRYYSYDIDNKLMVPDSEPIVVTR